MHRVFPWADVLACAHELVISPVSPPVVEAISPLLVDDGHPIEVVVGQVEMLPDFSLHFLAFVVVLRQVFDLEPALVINIISKTSVEVTLPTEHCPLLAALVVCVRNLSVALLWRHFLARDGTRIHVFDVVLKLVGAHELVLLALPGVNHSCALDISLLPGTSPATCNSLSILIQMVLDSTSLVLDHGVEVLTGPRKRRKT